MMEMHHWSLLLLMLCQFFLYVAGSAGDRSSEFHSCTKRCESVKCSSGAEKLGFALKLTGWSCLEDCQYQCMHEITAQDVKMNRSVRQFFGKWPFVRVLGVQEPASALFSLLNGITVTIGFVRFQRATTSQYPFHRILQFQYLVNINTWFWSTVFHTRDVYWTERLDYFSAAALVVTGLIVQFVRLSGPLATTWHLIYAGTWIGLFSCHVTYLTLYKFDYGYNMLANVAAGVVYTVIWLLWCVKHMKERPYVWQCALTVVATSCFVLLELLDFPPLWWTIDAHSLWHLSTVPLPFLWYSFLTADAEYEVQNALRKHV